MVRKRNPAVEYRMTEEVSMVDRPEESRKGQVSGYPATGEGKQNNEHSSLSQDSVTSTGEIIFPNGIRLWGMWYLITYILLRLLKKGVGMAILN